MTPSRFGPRHCGQSVVAPVALWRDRSAAAPSAFAPSVCVPSVLRRDKAALWRDRSAVAPSAFAPSACVPSVLRRDKAALWRDRSAVAPSAFAPSACVPSVLRRDKAALWRDRSAVAPAALWRDRSDAGGWAAAATVNPSTDAIVNSFIAQLLPGPRRHDNAKGLRNHGISHVTSEYKNLWENSEHVA